MLFFNEFVRGKYTWWEDALTDVLSVVIDKLKFVLTIYDNFTATDISIVVIEHWIQNMLVRSSFLPDLFVTSKAVEWVVRWSIAP